MTQIHNSPPKGYGCGLGSRDYKRIAIGQAETIKKLEKKIVDDKAWYDLGLKLLQNKYEDRIAALERQLAEAPQWRSIETFGVGFFRCHCEMDCGRTVYGLMTDCKSDPRDENLLGICRRDISKPDIEEWLPPEPKRGKE